MPKQPSLKTRFPYDQGWVHAKLTLLRPTPLNRQALIGIATCGSPEDYEVPYIEQRGKSIIAVTRHKSRAPAAAAAVVGPPSS